MIFGNWGIMVGLSLLACLLSFTARRSLTGGTDFLGGREEVEYFLRVDSGCLAATALATVADIIVFFKACVGQDNSDWRKPAACVVSTVIALFSCVAFIMSTSHIASDLSHTTTARPETYVLCTNARSEHFIGFTDRGEMTLIPVTTDTYSALQKGHELKDKDHSDIYNVILNNGYENTVEYDSAARIEYYFYSAMVEKAELLFDK